MGSLLGIVGNHKLNFSSGKDVINQFQSILNVEIKNGTYQSNEVKNKHEDPNQIEYFVALDYLDQNFERWKEVRLMTNYKYTNTIQMTVWNLLSDQICEMFELFDVKWFLHEIFYEWHLFSSFVIQ